MKNCLFTYVLFITTSITFSQILPSFPANPQPSYSPFGKWADVATNNPTWTTGSVGIGYSSSGANAMLQIKDSYQMASYGVKINISNYALGTIQKYGIYAAITGKGSAVYGKSSNSNGFSSFMEGKSYFSGNVGIGTQTPTDLLEIHNGNIVLGASSSRFVFQAPSSNNLNYINIAPENNGSWDYANAVSLYQNGTFVVKRKLYVNEKIFAKEIEVKLPPFPDFVFTPNYHLPSLQQIEKFININGHLPFYKSATNYETDFANLGELNVNTIEAIEVLYLHIIELNKELEELKKQIIELKN